MRCPKCHYISFDNGSRCRNCGYDFSLAIDVTTLDLPIQTGEEATGPLADLQLGEIDAPRPPARSAVPSSLSVLDPAAAPSETHGPRRSFSASALDLPLFSDDDGAVDRPLVTPPAVPRAPLAVRRGSPSNAHARPRGTPEPEEPVLALDAPDDEPALPRAPAVAREGSQREQNADAIAQLIAASLGRRAVAGIIDAAIILSIDAAIVYFTLRLSGLRLPEITLLPPVPFLAFILVLNGGYFASFVAAGGQTIGKMAAAIRVVPYAAGAGDRVSFGYAVLRAAAYLVSVLPAGIGLIPAFFSADRRTLHDRLADTRVVRS